MLLPVLIAIPALLTSPGTRPLRIVDSHQQVVLEILAREHAALALFDRSISDYMDLHRRLALTTPPLRVTADPVQLRGAIGALGEAIRLARPAAQPGNVFTPPVAAMFRRRIHHALGYFDVAGLMAEMEEDAEPCAPAPTVNGSFPWSAGNAMWPSVLAALPELPEALEYRFVGADLVLIDIPANLVVDVLEGALPPTEGS